MNNFNKISIISLFPEMFGALDFGVIGRKIRNDIDLSYFNPRDYADNKNGYIDDKPYGGGPGMVMQAKPLFEAMHAAQSLNPKGLRIFLGPSGQVLNHKLAKSLVGKDLILVCGRYEGVDQRFIDHGVDLEISIGDFVLSGGELAAMVLIDSVLRLTKNALGSEDSALNDSFVDGLLEFPQYTRPKKLENMSIPDILLSGNHADIMSWRRSQSLGLTWLRRKDLFRSYKLGVQDQALLAEFLKGDKSDRGNETNK